MKCLYLSLALSALALGQAPAPVAPATPQATPAQSSAQPQLAPDAVVAKVGNKPITVADIRKIMLALPPEVQNAFSQNPKNALQSLFMIDYLRTEAEKNNLADKSPYKEQLEFQRSQMLAQAAATSHQNEISVTEADEQKRYEEKKTQFDVAKIRAIHLTFTDPKAPAAQNTAPGPKITEAEAKAKADDLVKQLRGGADFAQIAKANSDDKNSAEKGGEYGSIRRGDNIPADIKTTIFALKPGDVSDPVRQPNGFYILKVDERATQAFKDVQPQLAQEIKQERYQQWMQGLQKQFEVSIENQEFFGQKKSSIPLTLQSPSAPPATSANK
jgi:parvulin-like peptidyl-prolyl isomerase